MLYFLSKTLGALQPTLLLVLLLLAGAAFLVRRRQSRLGLAFALAGAGGLAACALLPVGTWLMRPLENRFAPLRVLPDRIDGIILLGGAIDLDRSADRGMVVLNSRAQRMIDFVALANHYPHATLIFSGGNPRIFPSGPTEAEIARHFFGALGVDTARVRFEDASRNTHENALYARRMVRLIPGQRWLLVTSAADMPRAVGCFRAVGWPVIPYPDDYHTNNGDAGLLPGFVDGLETVDWATHEWVGLFYYRLRGWIPELFPSPL